MISRATMKRDSVIKISSKQIYFLKHFSALIDEKLKNPQMELHCPATRIRNYDLLRTYFELVTE